MIQSMRYLKMKKLVPRLPLRITFKDLIAVDENAYVILMIRFAIKRLSEEMEVDSKQYSGNAHGIVRGIGIVDLSYVDPQTLQFG